MPATDHLTDHLAGLQLVSLFRTVGDGPAGPRTIGEGVEVVELLTDGEAAIAIDGTWRRVGCGALLWHLPNEPTVCRLLGGPPYECLVVTFAVHHPVRRAVPRCSRFGDRQATRAFRDEVIDTYHRADYDQAALGRYLHAHLQWRAHVSSIRLPDPFMPPLLSRVLDHIDAHFDEDLAVADLAAVAGVSEAHLHRLFERHLQEAPFQVLRRRRLEEGRRLLAGTEQPVNQVAVACGMPDASNFGKRFKAATGLTPGAYREHHRTVMD